jgi:hypothetical protein
LILEPELAEAPLIAPILVPNVHAKVLAAVAVRLILGLLPLHVLAVLTVVIFGIGFTVTVIAATGPTHEPTDEVGVTL